MRRTSTVVISQDANACIREFAFRDGRTAGQLIDEMIVLYSKAHPTARKPKADPRGRPKASPIEIDDLAE